MNTTYPRGGMGWGGRLLIALTLILVGAAAAAWGLARYDQAARVLGVAPVPTKAAVRLVPAPAQASAQPAEAPQEKIETLEARLARLENATRQVAGSAGRADALLVAFAARRAIDRGVSLGYLEPLLVDRFGVSHPGAVATIVTGAHEPVTLAELTAEYERLGPDLRGGGPKEGLWTGFQRQLGELVEIRRADRPSVRPDARYNRALERLRAGEVGTALAETMRLPGAANAGTWVARARRYVAVQRALDEIESAALLPGNRRA